MATPVAIEEAEEIQTPSPCGTCRDSKGQFIGRYVYLSEGDEDKLERLCESWLQTYKRDNRFLLVTDVETQGLDYINQQILLFSISWNGRQSVVFSPYRLWGRKDSRGSGPSFDALMEVFSTVPIANQNTKFDAKWVYNKYGILWNICFDTMVAAQLGYAGAFPGKSFALDNLAEKLLKPLEISKQYQKSFIGQPVEQQFTENQIKYAGNDSMVTYRLIPALKNRISSQNLDFLWNEVELPLLRSLVLSEHRGVLIDKAAVEQAYEEKRQEYAEVLKTLRDVHISIPEGVRPRFKPGKANPGGEYNPNSPQHTVDLLDALGIKIKDTSEDTLLDACAKTGNEVLRKIVEAKQIQNGSLKYFKAWLEDHINPTTGCIHPNFKSCHADTGRMASSEPNMQNVPPELRHLVVARPGYTMVTADFCYDDQTEVLTNKGWARFKDLDGSELFYSMDPKSHECGLVPAKRLVRNNHDGSMVRTKGQGIDLLVTPNHRHYVNQHWDKKEDQWEFLEARECLQANRISLKRNCKPIDGIEPDFTRLRHGGKSADVPTLPWLFFLGYWLADGHVNRSDDRILVSDGSRENLEVLQKAINAWQPGAKIKRGPTCWILWFKDPFVASILRELGHAHDKRIPEYVWSHGSVCLEALFMGLMLGDGTNKRTNNQYTTVSPGLADDFQRLCLHVGLSASISKIERPERIFPNGKPSTVRAAYCVSVNASKNEPKVKFSQRNGFSTEHYQGETFCVELESRHLLYVRRNGKACWSGNSQFEFRAAAAYTNEQYLIDIYEDRATLLPDVVAVGHKYGEDDPDHLLKLLGKGKLSVTPGELELLNKFKGTDIHRRNAALVLGKDVLEIDDQTRSLGKTLGYALLYGSGPATMMVQLIKSGFSGVTVGDCKHYRGVFMEQLPKVARFIEETHERVHDYGYVQTFLGRRRYFQLPPRYMRHYEKARDDAYRQAVNCVMQGSNADATKIAIVDGSAAFEARFPDDELPMILLNVHDELVAEAPDQHVPPTIEILKGVMEEGGRRATAHKVPIEVSFTSGRTWAK